MKIVGIVIGVGLVSVALCFAGFLFFVAQARPAVVSTTAPSAPTDTTPPAAAPVKAEPQPEVKATGPVSIWTAYKRNEVGADNQFKAKRLRLIAAVADISKDALDHIVVSLEAEPPEDNAEPKSELLREMMKRAPRTGGTISARFEDEWAQQVGEIERGDVVDVECTGRGLHLGVPVLDDCALKWAQPRQIEPLAHQLGRTYELCLVDKYLPAILERLDAGTSLDGGPLPRDARSWFAKFKSMEEEDRKDLDRSKLDRLPCDHPALVLMKSCDEDKSSSKYPQCATKLYLAARDYVHH